MNVQSITYFFVLIFVITACQVDNRSNGTEERTFNTGLEVKVDSSTKVPLQETEHPIGNVHRVRGINQDTLIVRTTDHELHLVVQGEAKGKIGTQGEGPCEYQRAAAIDYHDGVLFIVDADGSKLIKIQLETGECIQEITDGQIIWLESVEVDNDNTFMAFSKAAGYVEDDQPMLYKLEGDDLKPLDFTLADHPSEFLATSIRIPVPADFTNSTLNLHYLFSEEIIRWNTEGNTKEIWNIDLIHEHELTPGEVETTDEQQEVMDNMEFGLALFAVGDEKIALSTTTPESNKVRFYDFESEREGYLEVPSAVAYVDSERIVFLDESEDPSAEPAYTISTLFYEIE